jgi:predicted O-methyltransferase YrrM
MLTVDISRALLVQGWMGEAELLWLAETASRCRSIVEIGSHMGRSACALAANTPGAVYCVDTWQEGQPYGVSLSVFRQNTAHLTNVLPVHCPSLDAARAFAAEGKRFNFIFVDADHTEDAIRQDILAWRPLLAEGGVFAGHDFSNADWPDVEMVVRELIPEFEVIDSIWVAKKL